MTIKVMRAENWDRSKVRFPVWAEPKIDGVRGYNPEGTLLARTMKLHGNRYTTDYFSQPEYVGFDGELAAQDERHPDLCRTTTSATSSYEGTPYTLWHLFDYVTPQTIALPYWQRHGLLQQRVQSLRGSHLGERLRVVPYTVCNNLEELDAAHLKHMLMGYEGTVFYGPDVPHKEGKSSPRHNGCLRIKDFIDFEGVVTGITEGETNLNEAQINELGRQFRSSHKEGKVPNGMIGSLQARSLANVFDPYSKKLLIAKDQNFTASPGKMLGPEKVMYFENPGLLLGKPSKFKFFGHGMKDAPRFPQWMSLRAVEDL